MSLTTGRHAAEWELEDEWIPGDADLNESDPPSGSSFGVPPSLRHVRGFPHDVDVGEVRGRLRQGQDVVFGDTKLSVWFPGRALLLARWALVGLGIHEVPANRYRSLEMQITGLESFFGRAAIESMTWPSNDSNRTYSVTAHEYSAGAWESDGIRVESRYDPRFGIGNAYKYELAFAPVIEVEADPALTADEWVEGWVTSLLGLIALATGEPQSVAWVNLCQEVEEVLPGKPPELRRRRAQLFGSGISQKPFLAETPTYVRERGTPPLFTLARLSRPLPEVVARWRTLERGQDPFLELIRPLLFDKDLPPRARLLHLFQALEALHGHESQEDDAKQQERFRRKRTETLERLAQSNAADEDVRFVRDTWSTRRPDSLARRLRELVAWIPEQDRNDLRRLSSTPLGLSLADDAKAPIENRLQRLRNDLAHGNTNPSHQDLRPWADAMDKLARVHLLRRLGFTQAEVEEAAKPTPARESDDADASTNKADRPKVGRRIRSLLRNIRQRRQDS